MAEKVVESLINVDGINFEEIRCLSLSEDLVGMIEAYSGGKYNYMRSRMGIAIRDSDNSFMLRSCYDKTALSKLGGYHFLHDRFAYVMGISDNVLYKENTNKHSNGLLFEYKTSMSIKSSFPIDCKFGVYYKDPYLLFEFETNFSEFHHGYGGFLIECCIK